MSTPPQDELLNQLQQLIEEAKHQWWLGLTTAEKLNFVNEQAIQVTAAILMFPPVLP